ncbi:MAG: DUF190 domain-containing protein [Gammaproteobacteria bacterium]|nr:DUF190 domain-containing protein [Gammaproteobacteria bacterium]
MTKTATTAVTVVRIYLTEGEGTLNALLKQLHDVEQVRGVSVFRAISGFGSSGALHTSTLLDLSLDLPLVVEFFDTPDKVQTALSHLQATVDAQHIISWSAQLGA